MSRHESTGLYQPFNHPLPVGFLQSHHPQLHRSQPMTPQYSNQSYESTSSGSYDSNSGSYISASPNSYVICNDRQSANGWARHHSQDSSYDAGLCISPLELQSNFHSDSRHNYASVRAVPSSAQRHTADYGASHHQDVSQRSDSRGNEDNTSNHTEKDRKQRVACDYEGCTSTFSRKADIKRHYSSAHHIELIDCDVNKCTRKGDSGFARRDHLLEHKRGYHSLPIPKRHSKSSKDRHE